MFQHASTQFGLAQASGCWIDGCERLRQRLALLDDAVARVRHFGAEKTAPHFAECTNPKARLRGALKLPQLTGIEIEKAQHQSFGVDHELAPGPVHNLRLQYIRFHAHGRGLRRRFDRGKEGFVLVAQRKVQREVGP